MKHNILASSIVVIGAAGATSLLAGFAPRQSARADLGRSAQTNTTKAELSPADALRRVEAVLLYDGKLPARLPSRIERQIEALVDRVDWAKAGLDKAGRRLPDIASPHKTASMIGQDDLAPAYALIYAAEDAMMGRPQVVLESAGLLPVRGERDAQALKKEIEHHSVQSGPDVGLLKPFRWRGSRIAFDMTMSKTWPWKRDTLTGRLSLGPVYWEPVPDVRDVAEPVSDYYWKMWRRPNLRHAWEEGK